MKNMKKLIKKMKNLKHNNNTRMIKNIKTAVKNKVSKKK